MQLELDLDSLRAIAVSRDATEILIAGRRPGTSRLTMTPQGIATVSPWGTCKFLSLNPIPLHPWLNDSLASKELEQHLHELTNDGWDE